MNFEQLQNQWQQQTEGESIVIQTDFLLKEVRRNKQYFDAMIFWRDIREIGIALILVVAFLYFGWKGNSWTSYLLAGACIFIIAFFAVDRYIRKRKKKGSLGPLYDCITASLDDINHQIKLLKNVFWWYILPIAAAGLVAGANIAFIMNDTWMSILKDFSGDILTWGILSFVIWKINQYAVKKELVPRKEELEELLKSIENLSQEKE